MHDFLWLERLDIPALHEYWSVCITDYPWTVQGRSTLRFFKAVFFSVLSEVSTCSCLIWALRTVQPSKCASYVCTWGVYERERPTMPSTCMFVCGVRQCCRVLPHPLWGSVWGAVQNNISQPAPRGQMMQRGAAFASVCCVCWSQSLE